MVPITFSATVTDIRLESRKGTAARWQIALNHTLFSTSCPRGTLIAVAPSGARLHIPLLQIHEEGGTLWHTIDKPLAEGTEITGMLAEFFA